jgi:hypothetical protein
VAAAACRPAARDSRHAAAGRRGCRLRDDGGVRVRRLARGLRLPASQRPVVRSARARPGLPRGAGARQERARPPARSRGGDHDGHRLRLLGAVGAVPVRAARRPGRDLVRLPARVHAPRPDASGLLRCLRRDLLPRALRHRARNVGMAATRPHRAAGNRQPAERHRRRVLLLRRGRVVADAAAAGALRDVEGRYGARPGQHDHGGDDQRPADQLDR